MRLKNLKKSSPGFPFPVEKPPLRLRPKGAAALVPCSVGTIYTWMEEDRFKHWSIKPPGKNRGLRFIDTADFMRFLAAMEQEGNK
jgi:hypothetical protein